jgi:hypothetical protein
MRSSSIALNVVVSRVDHSIGWAAKPSGGRLPKEVRVHGVSGTPPTELLYTNPVTYDQGWDLAKIYERNRDDWDVKAYHWGSLTSKSSLTALWILLAPFAMANAAGWMSESPSVWSRAWIRVAGLSLTGIFFVQVANMTLDVPLNTGLEPTAVKWVFATATLALVLGLGWLSTQSSFKPLTARERLRHLFSPTIASMNPLLKEPEWDDPAGGCSVVGSRMWSVHSIVHRLRRIHLTFGMAVLAVVVGRAMENPALEIVAMALAGVMLVALGLTNGPVANNRVVLVSTGLSTLAGLAILIWGLFVLVGSELGPRVDVSDDLTYEIALILGVAAGLGLLGELLTSRLRGGWVPLGLLAVATLIGGTLGLTGAMLVETYLSESATTAETFDGGAAFVTVGMLGLVIVSAITFAIATFFPKPGNDGSRMRRGILRARLMLGVAGAYGAAFAAVAAWLSCQGAAPGCSHRNLAMPDWVVEDPGNMSVLLGIPFDPTSLLGWAKIVMVAVPALLIVRSIVGGLLNGQESRRQVGILWDLGSFWPRWFHPLAPPAYGPYAVTRLQTILSEEKPDVLAAHSQGSLIAAVAMCLADEDDRPGLFVTYGSQLGDLYPSLFPAVGLADLVSATSRQVAGRWINLWRGSDAVGGQVISELESRNWEVTTGKGHSRYELTPEFCAARKAVLTGDLVRPADPVMARCWEGRQ